jgi:hypothetical protein
MLVVVVIVINAAARREVAQRVEMVVKRGLVISREMPERLWQGCGASPTGIVFRYYWWWQAGVAVLLVETEIPDLGECSSPTCCCCAEAWESALQ